MRKRSPLRRRRPLPSTKAASTSSTHTIETSKRSDSDSNRPSFQRSARPEPHFLVEIEQRAGTIAAHEPGALTIPPRHSSFPFPGAFIPPF